jgi:hypothetical protein
LGLGLSLALLARPAWSETPEHGKHAHGKHAHGKHAPAKPAPETPAPATPAAATPAPATPAAATPAPATPAAATPAAATPAPATPAPAAAPAAAAKPPEHNGASLDFDLFGDQKAQPSHPTTTAQSKDPAVLERQVRRRRTVLQLHQGFGFATLALLAATCVIGQLNYIDKYGGGNFTDRYQTPHLALAMASTGTFAVTGLLGLFAPNPYKKPIRADAALAHKILMGFATAGMAAQVALGFVTAAKGGELFQRDLALTHLVTGYATFATMTAGYLAFVF